MAFPQVATSASSRETSNTTSHTMDLPASIEAGDLLFAAITVDASPQITLSGWTKFLDSDDTQDGTNQALRLYWRAADGGEGATQAFTTTAAQESAHAVYRITGAADPTGDPPTASIAAQVISSSTHNPPSHTPGGGAKDYMWIAGTGTDSEITASTYPTNYSSNQITIAGPNDPGSVGVSIATDEVNASSENPGAYTMTASDSGWPFTVAIWPGPAGTDYTETITDAVGVTDSTPTAKGATQTITDDVGITDSVTTAKSISQTVTDDVGVTDSTSAAKSIAQIITDAVGITDSVTRAMTLARTITDALGVTDVLSSAKAIVLTVTDALGITDSVSTVATITFTPGTYGTAITNPEQTNPKVRPHASMWRHYGSMLSSGYTVIITDGVATASPGRIGPSVDDIKGADAGSGDDGRSVFTRNATYTITAAERDILITAGYAMD